MPVCANILYSLDLVRQWLSLWFKLWVNPPVLLQCTPMRALTVGTGGALCTDECTGIFHSQWTVHVLVHWNFRLQVHSDEDSSLRAYTARTVYFMYTRSLGAVRYAFLLHPWFSTCTAGGRGSHIYCPERAPPSTSLFYCGRKLLQHTLFVHINAFLVCKTFRARQLLSPKIADFSNCSARQCTDFMNG